MDCKLQPCSSSNKKLKLLQSCTAHDADRLTSLPDELLCRILCMLPTKDAAATLVLSKRMRQAFAWITSFDLDDSPIDHCTTVPNLVDRFHVFQSFLDYLLLKFSPPLTHLTRFRLHFGGQIVAPHQFEPQWRYYHCRGKRECFPDVVPARLYRWISFPLNHVVGLRELDLSFYVRRPHQCTLPSTLFACQSLQLLKLTSNLDINNANIPLLSLPNLKLLYLSSFVFKDDDFVARLVLSSPVLEDLSINRCLWMIGDRVSISSPSLRSLFLFVRKKEEFKSGNLLLLHTPNLQHLHYYDRVAARYSIAPMNALVKAFVSVLISDHHFETELITLVRALSHVPDLSLLGSFVEHFYFVAELRDQLPMFLDLRTLELGDFYSGRWDIVLLLILHRSPSLETLVFREGLFLSEDEELTVLEAEGWRKAHAISLCCISHLKRIVFKRCYGSARELSTIKFLLAKSSILEELVLHFKTVYTLGKPFEFDHPKFDQFENIVKDLPRSSSSCLITVHR